LYAKPSKKLIGILCWTINNILAGKLLRLKDGIQTMMFLFLLSAKIMIALVCLVRALANQLS
jgi:hypothetical protein